MLRIYDGGLTLRRSCNEAFAIAKAEGCTVHMRFNNIPLWVIPDAELAALKPGFLEDKADFSRAMAQSPVSDEHSSAAPVLLLSIESKEEARRAFDDALSFKKGIDLPLKLYFNGLVIDVDTTREDMQARYNQAKDAYFETPEYQAKWAAFCKRPELEPALTVAISSTQSVPEVLEKVKLLCRPVSIITGHGAVRVGPTTTRDDVIYDFDKLYVAATTDQGHIDFYDTVLLPKGSIPDEPINTMRKLLPRAISRGETEIVKWVADFIVFQNRFPIPFSHDAIDSLNEAGYQAVSHTRSLRASAKPKTFAKNLIGRVIDCLEKAEKIPEQYRSLSQDWLVLRAADTSLGPRLKPKRQ